MKHVYLIKATSEMGHPVVAIIEGFYDYGGSYRGVLLYMVAIIEGFYCIWWPL